VKRLVSSMLASLLVASTLHAQTRTIAERLGHPRDAKLVILHADDLGVAHSEDSASFDALNRGAVNSASVMMPTPWVTEVAAYTKAHPNADIGLHLTLTAEWKTYRWGGLVPRDQVPSLYDRDGTFPLLTQTVVVRAKPAEVEKEIRAQIQRAQALGIRPTHLDSHMAALYSTPELFRTYVQVARSYKLPFNFHGTLTPGTRAALTANDIIPDTVVMAEQAKSPAEWMRFYVDAVRHLKPGLTQIIVHLGYDDSELRAVTAGYDVFEAKWRQRDYDVMTSPEFQQALKDNHVVLVTWRDIQKAMYPTLP
jgi:predicted glycoside hydrolase/deacetylase ChbG (UPF0249 family)